MPRAANRSELVPNLFTWPRWERRTTLCCQLPSLGKIRRFQKTEKTPGLLVVWKSGNGPPRRHFKYNSLPIRLFRADKQLFERPQGIVSRKAPNLAASPKKNQPVESSDHHRNGPLYTLQLLLELFTGPQASSTLSPQPILWFQNLTISNILRR